MKQKKIVIKKGSTQAIVTGKAADGEYVLEEGASLCFVLSAGKGWAGKPLIGFDLMGSGSKLEFFAVLAGGDDDNFEFGTRIIHRGARTQSLQEIRSAMSGRSFAGFTGNISIEKPAAMSEAYLAHRTLLLSKDARVSTLPALEIKAKDVKAGHAATAGKIDDESLFYLQTRGLGEKQAKDLLVAAFFESLLGRIGNDDARRRARSEIMKNFNNFTSTND